MEVDFNTMLAAAFGAWAAVVGWIGRRLLNQLEQIGTRIEKEAEKFNQYVVQTESRLAVLERETRNK